MCCTILYFFKHRHIPTSTLDPSRQCTTSSISTLCLYEVWSWRLDSGLPNTAIHDKRLGSLSRESSSRLGLRSFPLEKDPWCRFQPSHWSGGALPVDLRAHKYNHNLYFSLYRQSQHQPAELFSWSRATQSIYRWVIHKSNWFFGELSPRLLPG